MILGATIRRAAAAGSVLVVAGLCVAAAVVARHVTVRAAPHPLVSHIPGIPDAPDDVTVVRFYEKPDETPLERTKVVISAWVDSAAYGNFVLDLGAPRLNLNRTFLQPGRTGGVDSVTAGNRIPERGVEDSVHVTLRIGSLSAVPVDPGAPPGDPDAPNAFLNHLWGNFSWVFAPRLGNIGLSVLRPFETIIDYTHKRVVLIRLDSAGRRLVKVQAYTPVWTTRLIDVAGHGPNDSRRWWGITVRPDGVLDTANTRADTVLRAMDSGAPSNGRLLGYPFLRGLGTVGFNHRAHQFILYRYAGGRRTGLGLPPSVPSTRLSRGLDLWH